MEMNTTKDALKQAVDNLKSTIPRMKDLEIPITPENYFVWYEFENGKNKKLIDTLERRVEINWLLLWVIQMQEKQLCSV